MPGLRDLLPSTSDGVNVPQEFFSMLARHFSQKAAQNDGIPLLYLRPYKDESDQETRRLAQTFAQFGIESTTSTNHLRKIEIREGKDAGIFLKSAGRTQRRGTHLSCWPRTATTAPSYSNDKPRPKNRIYMNEIVQAFIRALHAPSLSTAILNGRAWTNFSPGVQFVNDKILVSVDAMIRHFLKNTAPRQHSR